MKKQEVTQEMCDAVVMRLEGMGFINKRPEHMWNCVQCELPVNNETTIIVWAREYFDGCIVAISQGYEETIQVYESWDPDRIWTACVMVRALFEGLAKI